jgi:aspartokinase
MVVVPSAMSGETNRLLVLARTAPEKLSDDYSRELDMLAATGEQVRPRCSRSPCRPASVVGRWLAGADPHQQRSTPRRASNRRQTRADP